MLRLCVTTYNIRKGMIGTARRVHVYSMRQGLRNMDADIVFPQEVWSRGDRLVAAELFDPNYMQLHYLMTGAYPHTACGRNVIYEHEHHDNTILSRFSILLSENLDIPDHRLGQRGLLHAMTDLSLGEVHLLCAHFGLFAHS